MIIIIMIIMIIIMLILLIIDNLIRMIIHHYHDDKDNHLCAIATKQRGAALSTATRPHTVIIIFSYHYLDDYPSIFR